MNQGNFNMGMSQGMAFQQPGYGVPMQSSAQTAFMGGSQMGNQQQMWPMQGQGQGQSSMMGMQQGGMAPVSQQGGMAPMPPQVQQASGQAQDLVAGQQAAGQVPGQARQPQGGNVQGLQGFSAAGFQQYPQQGQGYQM